MNQFEYAHPQTEAEAVALLTEHDGTSSVLAAGMDLVPLLQKSLVEPQRVVDITRIDSLRGIEPTDDGIVIGALTTLEEIADSALLAEYPSLADVVHGVRAIQVQQTGTIGGDLCHLPNCWYFRSGYGLLGLDNGRSLPEVGDNRYHAIFGNAGPAKFVSASRFAPALISWGAEVRIAGPEPSASEWVRLIDFYRTPKQERQGVTMLMPGQFVTHVKLPPVDPCHAAIYEVLESAGLDWPLAAAAVRFEMKRGVVSQCIVVLGHVAPQPWVSFPAADSLIGRPVTPETAAEAGRLAVCEATPLSENAYKVRLAQTSVERALLKAAGQLEGGL